MPGPIPGRLQEPKKENSMKKKSKRGRKPMPDAEKRVTVHLSVAPWVAELLRGIRKPGRVVDNLVESADPALFRQDGVGEEAGKENKQKN